MPLLDVSDILSDPMIGGEVLTIQRRAETVDQKGRSQVAPITVTPAPVGNVQPASGGVLVRNAAGQYLPKVIEVFTVFRLRSESPAFQPDTVIWNGNPYVVKLVDDWSRYGAGYIRAECEAMDMVDNPPA